MPASAQISEIVQSPTPRKNPETVDNRHNRRILKYRFTQSGIFCIYRHFIYFNIFISQQD